MIGRTGIVLLVLLLAAGCGSGDATDDADGDAATATADTGDDEGNADGSDGDEDEDAVPVPVQTARPQRGDIHALYSGTAAVEAFAEADVVAKVGGEVVALEVEEGDSVARGDEMARLDGDRLRLELAETEARLAKLRRDFDRNTDLRDKGLISEGDYDQIRFDLEALEAAANLARLEVAYTIIRAPLDGVVSERIVKRGNTIAVGDPLFRVTSLDPLVSYLHVPEREYRHLRAGQEASITVDALPGETISASVSRVSPVIDPETGTFKITIEISDPERRVKPGMFARVAIVYDSHRDALQVPRSAVIDDDGETSVYVVEDGRALRRPVVTGYALAGRVEIVDGLDDDDEIVTVGQLGLKPDTRVTIIGNDGSDDASAD